MIPLKKVYEQKPNSNGDTGIRNIESRPVVPVIKKIKKVDHLMVKDAINEVADRATENQDQTHMHYSPVARSLMKKHKDRHNRDCRKYNENQALEFRTILSEQTKGDTRVANVSEREKIPDHLHGITLGDMSGDPGLGELVQNDQDIGNAK